MEARLPLEPTTETWSARSRRMLATLTCRAHWRRGTGAQRAGVQRQEHPAPRMALGALDARAVGQGSDASGLAREGQQLTGVLLGAGAVQVPVLEDDSM